MLTDPASAVNLNPPSVLDTDGNTREDIFSLSFGGYSITHWRKMEVQEQFIIHEPFLFRRFSGH